MKIPWSFKETYVSPSFSTTISRCTDSTGPIILSSIVFGGDEKTGFAGGSAETALREVFGEGDCCRNIGSWDPDPGWKGISSNMSCGQQMQSERVDNGLL
jgi:hypothetical protein